MAKTIKEMAYNHFVAYMNNDEYEEMQDTYIAGANAALNEIVKFADSTWGSKSLNSISLKKKIEALKG